MIHYIKSLVNLHSGYQVFILLILISISLFLPQLVFATTSPLVSLAVHENGIDRISNFSTNTFTYSANVDVTTEELQIIANLTDFSSSYTVMVEPVLTSTIGTSGVPLDIALSNTGTTTFTIVVAEQSGVTHSYTVEIKANGICGRQVTASNQNVVINKIVNAISGVDNCADVTTAQLGNIFNSFLSPFNIAGSSIAEIPNGTFSGLHSLYLLDLSNNQLTTLSSGIFSDLRNLTSLQLKNNLLNNLSADIFSGLGDTLGDLNLSNNPQMNLPTTIFLNLIPIERTLGLTVFLFVKPPKSALIIPAGIFSGLESEKFSLDLAGNGIGGVTPPILSGINVSEANTTDPAILLKGAEYSVEVSLEIPLSAGSFSVTAVSTNANITLTPSAFTWTANGGNNQILNITANMTGSTGIFFQYDITENVINPGTQASAILETAPFLFEIVQPEISISSTTITVQNLRDLTLPEGIQAQVEVTTQLTGQDTEVTLYTPPNSGISISTTTVTLVGGVTETVIIHVVDDNVYYPSRQSTITVSVGHNATTAIIPLSIQDNDALTFSVSNIDTLTEGEGRELMISVNALPEGEEIDVDIQAASGLEISQTQLRFTTELTTQSIQVLATDTRLSEGDREGSITVSANGYPTAIERLTIKDNDNLIIMTTPKELVLIKGRGSQALEIQIYAQVPEKTTTVHLVSHIANLISVSSETVVLQGEEIKTITIALIETTATAADDNVYYPSVQSTLTVSGSQDVIAAIIPVRIEDNDTLTFSISNIDTLTEGEGRELMISVSALPEGEEIDVDIQATNGLEISQTQLRFTTALTTQSIQVLATDTRLSEGDREGSITVSANGYSTAIERLTIKDNDNLIIMTTPQEFVLVEGASTSLAIQVSAQPPERSTTVHIMTDAANLISISSEMITLQGEEIKTITINVIDDNIYLPHPSRQTILTVSGAGIIAAIIPLSFEDNEPEDDYLKLRMKAYIDGAR